MMLHVGKPILVVSSAEAAHEIMKTHDLTFADRAKSSVAARLLYNYKDISTAPYGERWRQMKSIFMLRLLNSKRVESFHSVREEEVALVIKEIKEKSSNVNLSEIFVNLTNNVTCRAAFGKKYGEGESGKKFKKLLGDLLVLLGSRNLGSIIPKFSWLNKFNGFDAQVDRVAKELDEFLEEVVEERTKKMIVERENGEEAKEERKDFFDILLGIYKEKTSGVSIDRDNVKALILSVFAAGTDTTSTSLEWAMTEIIKHPTIMTKLQNEVSEVLKGKVDMVKDDLEKMKYLKAVIKETFRFHPPIPLLVPRLARQNVKVMGYDIPDGTMVITNAYAIGRDPALWAEPDEFMPERFLSSSVDFKGQDFELIPFGAGRRICPGVPFAVSLIELVLANLVLHFDWVLPHGMKGDDLDMAKSEGATTHRKIPLFAVAISRS